MKKLLYGLGALLLLILLAGIILTQVVDTDRVKRVLIEQTKEKTGRTLVINGDLSWRFFPSIGFTVTDTALLNPPGFEGGNTLSIGELSLDVALKPLFNNRLEVGEAVLNKARLHLITRADGVTNIDDLRALAEKQSAASASDHSKTAPATPNTGSDEATQAPNTTSAKEPMSFSLAGVHVQDAEVLMQNLAKGKLIRLNGVNVKLDDFAPDKTVPLSLSGNLFSDDLQGNIVLAGDFWVAPEFNRLLLSNLNFEASATGRAIPGNKQLKLQGQLAYDLDKKQAEFTELNLETGELKVTGQLLVNHLALPELSFNLHTDSLNVDALQAEWRSVTPSTTGKTKVESKAKTQKKETANQARVASQDTDAAAASVPGTLSKAKSSDASGSLLQRINLEGDLKADKVTVQGIELEQLDVHIKSTQGKLEFKPLQAQLYEGQVNADIKLDFSAAPTRFSMNNVLTGVNADALLSAATQLDYIQGRADINLDVKGAGFSAEQLQKHLTGTANLSVVDGALEGVNIAALIRRAHAQIKGLPVPAKEDVEKTDFSALTADFVIEKGVVSTDNLHLASPLLRIDGKGNTQLADESLDVLLNTAIVGSIKGQDGEELDELKNIILPIRISGTYKDPQYRLDLQQVFDVYLSEKADKEAERFKRKLDEKLGDKLGDKLNKKLGDKLPGLLDKLGL